MAPAQTQQYDHMPMDFVQAQYSDLHLSVYLKWYSIITCQWHIETSTQ